ncbi:MAG: phosphoribosylformylglycinamidine synthase subunit PurQ [Phycisphaerales bacterium JB039]
MARAIVIRTEGINCDEEMVRGFRLAGAEVELLHLGRLAPEPQRLDGCDLIGFPGGFSYGDDIASGRIFGARVREALMGPLQAAAARGCAMIGICNGFQVMVEAGLLPGIGAGSARGAMTLCDNASGRYEDRWVGVDPEPSSACVWTRPLAELPDETRMLPVGHGEGRLVFDSPQTLARLEAAGQIALRYRDNFNGSQGAVAGVCDPSGRIFGLMPHPDRFLDWTRHPFWTRLDPSQRGGEAPGVRMFRAAVEAVASAAV